jgi:hypothetical protein
MAGALRAPPSTRPPLTHRLLREAADREEEIAPEHAEGAGDDQEAVHARPCDSRSEEAAQVLDHLRRLGPVHRDSRQKHHAVLDLAAVGNPDRAADRDDAVGVGGE